MDIEIRKEIFELLPYPFSYKIIKYKYSIVGKYFPKVDNEEIKMDMIFNFNYLPNKYPPHYFKNKWI